MGVLAEWSSADTVDGWSWPPPPALVAASFPAKIERDAAEIRDFVDVLLAAQSVRRAGSAALNFCFLAAGRYDGYWSFSTKPWDIAAGLLIAREAGAVHGDVKRTPGLDQHVRLARRGTVTPS